MELQRRELIEFKICKDTDHEEVQKIIAENANGALFLYPSYTIQAPTLRSRNLQENLTTNCLFHLIWMKPCEAQGSLVFPVFFFLEMRLFGVSVKFFKKENEKQLFTLGWQMLTSKKRVN